tara:strand:- start:111 stop:335 length:225 start_codon:yes stop_codon:yes gene_type:complete
MKGIKSPNTYTVEWKELVTYKIEVEADTIEEAEDEAYHNYSYENDLIDVDHWDGSTRVEIIKEGEIEEDPDRDR